MLEISERSHLQESLERDRLEELRSYAIAGTEPEPRFDMIGRVAGNLFKTPMAFLTLVEDERQWFKAAIGSTMTETPRATSFCTHTIMSDDVLVIPDASIDPRFADNPLVTGEPKMRFYAGAPLVAENGLRLGALCVVDTVPREFSSEQRVALKDLAALAMHQIAARRSEFSTMALAGLAQSFSQPLLAVGPNGAIEFANRPAAELFDRQLADLKGARMDELISSGRLGMDAQGLIAVFQDAQAGVVSRPFKRVAMKSDGSEVPVEITVSRWDAAAGAGIAIVVHNLAEKAASAFQGLNVVRRERGAVPASDLAVGQLLDQLQRDGGQAGLFLLSLDGFEGLCEKLGRHMGQTILQSAAVRLQRLLPGAAIIARAKSDDFAIIVQGIGSAADGRRISEQLTRGFEDVFDLGVRLLQLTASIGFAVGSLHGDSADTLIANASFALHEVRRAGGCGALMYDEALRVRSRERHQVQMELTQALKNGEFRLFYQPQVSLVDGSVLGVEALIRWQHPARGLLRPQDFLIDVEEGSLSLPIGWWTLETACAQLAAWRAQGLPDVRVGVNLFPSQFRSERLLPYVTELLLRYDIEPSRLELEVTETIALLGDEQGQKSLNALRHLGVRIAFDDFGTGYASLSSLQQLPLTTLKLDRGFVRNLLTNANDAVITRSIIAMANDLHLTTIAEGVETPEQEAFLRMLGCELGQGYLYSQAVPADEIGNMLACEMESPVSRFSTVRVAKAAGQ